MINIIAAASAASALPTTSSQPSADQSSKASAATPASAAATTSSERPVKPQAQPDVRLIVEENTSSPGFIYKLVDSVTGATLAEIPREADSAATLSDSYAAGKVVSTTA